MAETIYWILAILVMLILLTSTIYNLIDRVKTNKEFKEISKKHIEEYLDKQIKSLESEDK